MDVRGFLALPALLGSLSAWARRRLHRGNWARGASVSIDLGSLRLRVLRRVKPSANDAWCRNQLLVDAHCKVQGCTLAGRGTLLSAVDLQAWCLKLPPFLEGELTELHLCSVSDRIGLHLQRPVQENLTAVTVALVDPARDGHTLYDAWHSGRGLLFLVTQLQLQEFFAQLERAMHRFPVRYGHAQRQPA
ncbi:hypothetical protein SAMN02799615_01317 [Dyella marensis]|jgi:hypothetical protein|uniref:Uncharacterized protein n=1 Tax=Dyella marensis TaxID=500610 RepID=A0A1I2C250_9GAMM|nr:hypothetical protein SAMN02799615_01317 [Dyella marensis]